MKRVVIEMSKRNKIEFELKEVKYQIWRLHDEEKTTLRRSSIKINNDSSLFTQFNLWQDKGNSFNLARRYLILEHLFGESSSFDSEKCSFYFPLLLSIEKESRPFFYLLNIYDLCGITQHSFYKIMENGVENYCILPACEPIETEFSQEEINYFISYFEGYLIGRFQSAGITPDKPFLKEIGSDFILYGYKDGEYFEQDYKSEEEYFKAIKCFKDTYGASQNKTGSDITALLNKIIQEE
jgi:hypothetical protein